MCFHSRDIYDDTFVQDMSVRTCAQLSLVLNNCPICKIDKIRNVSNAINESENSGLYPFCPLSWSEFSFCKKPVCLLPRLVKGRIDLGLNLCSSSWDIQTVQAVPEWFLKTIIFNHWRYRVIVGRKKGCDLYHVSWCQWKGKRSTEASLWEQHCAPFSSGLCPKVCFDQGKIK